MFFNLPTLLTWARIVAIPLIVGVFYLKLDPPVQNLSATVLFVVVAITDWLDGWLARRLNMTSSFGAFLDPVADKFLVCAALLVLVHMNRVHALVAFVIIGREIAISALREWMAQIGASRSVAVHMLGKVKTAVQLVAIPFLLFDGSVGDFDPQQPIEETLATLINQIADGSGRVILLLDDFHLIEDAAIGDALAFLIDKVPPQLRLTLASRSDPLLPLAGLRTRGELTELRAADLRFTPEEAASFLNQAMGLTLSPDDVTALDTRTEGWIAGLQLAALSMREQSDIPAFIADFAGSNRFVIDYLIEEVLHRLSRRARVPLSDLDPRPAVGPAL